MKTGTKKRPISFEELHKKGHNETIFNTNYINLTNDPELEFDIALQLIHSRVSAGLTQEELAIRMGTTPSLIARLESGTNLPSAKTLSLYVKAIGKHLYSQF